jgi:hypothetical protein
MNPRLRSLTLVWCAGAALAGSACAKVIDIPSDRHVTGAIASDGRCTGVVSVRVLSDTSAPFQVLETSFIAGSVDYLRELNTSGGLRGCAIDLDVQDSGGDVLRVQQIYDDWKARSEWKSVAALIVASTNATLQIAPQATADRKPLLSGSYFGALASPLPVGLKVDVPEVGPTFETSAFPTEIESVGYPYTFFIGTDYSTSGRVAMYQVKNQGGQRVGFVHCSVAFCTGPLPALRTYANELNLPLGRDLALELTDAQDAYDAGVLQYFQQELNERQRDPTYQPVDWLWMGNTTPTTTLLANAVARANAQLGLNVQIVVNNRGFDESLPAACGPACVEIVHGIVPSAFYGDLSRGPEMAKVTALHDKWRQAEASAEARPERGDLNYVQGYINARVFQIAAERALEQGLALTGENLKDALEGFDKVDTGGLTDLISFHPGDHRPQSAVTIYKITPDGALVAEGPSRKLSLLNGWLGW